MKEFPLTFRSRNFETWYRFHEDGSYEIVQKNKVVSSFSFGKFLEYPTSERADYMRKIAERHETISEKDFNTQMDQVFNKGYEEFANNLINNSNRIKGEEKTISFIDNKELSQDTEGDSVIVSLQESEVDRVVREMKEEERKNFF